MVKVEHLIEDATASTTVPSTTKGLSIRGTRRVTIVAQRSGHVAGSSVVSVKFTAKDRPTATSDFGIYNRLISNVTNTNVQEITRVASITLSSNTVEFISLSPEDILPWIQIGMTRVTDGTNNLWLVSDFSDSHHI